MPSITLNFGGPPAILQASRGLYSLEAPSASGTIGTGGSGLTFSPSSLPNATVGTAYSQLLTATGGTAPYYWNMESASPNSARWLAIPVATLLGNPQAAEVSTVVVRATDSVGITATKTYTITSAATGSLAIVTSTLPYAANGSFYAYQLIAQGGIPPYTWSWTAAQPWQVTADGWLEGTPTSTGTVTFSGVTVTDSRGSTVTFSPQVIVIGASSSIASYDSTTGYLNLPPARAGVPYSYQLIGYGAGSWSLATGALPAGLSMSSGGLITGTPAASGNYTSSIQYTTGAVKWNPGHYMLSYNENGSPTSTGGSGFNHSEIVTLASSGANVIGYEAIYYWGNRPSNPGLDLGSTAFATNCAGASSGTLDAAIQNWVYTVRFYDGEYRQVTVGDGSGVGTSTSCTWSPALNAGSAFYVGYFYLFKMIQADYADLQATAAGKHFAIMIWAERYGGTGATNLGIPNYILNNSVYGAGYDGTHYGYWALGSGTQSGVVAAVWRPAVATQIQLMFDALANTPTGNGSYTFDTDPLVEAIFFQESSMTMLAGSDFSVASFETQWEAIHASMVASFPHTNVAVQLNFVNTSQAASQTLVANAATNRQAMSSPDVFYPYPTNPLTTDGQYAYTGYQWNGSAWVSGGTDYRSLMTYIAQVEAPDYPNAQGHGSTNVVDLFNVANTNLRSTHIFWQNIGTDSYAGWTTNIVPMINANPLTNTGYPGNYP